MTESQTRTWPAYAMDQEGREGAAAEYDEHTPFVHSLFRLHREALLRYLSGLLKSGPDAEDVLQETYLRLLAQTNLDRSAGTARAYLFRIATNLAYDCFRRRRATGVATNRLGTLGGGATADEGPENIVDFEQGLEIVRRALLDLRPRCRRVFLLRVAEGLAYEEIATRLGVSKRTVEREMRRALHLCQRRLKRSA